MSANELPDELQNALKFILGMEWPEGDVAGLNRISSAWSEFSGAMEAMEAAMQRSGRGVQDNMGGEFAESYRGFADTLREAMVEIRTNADGLADVSKNTAADIQYAKIMIIAQLVIMIAMMALQWIPFVGQALAAAAQVIARVVISQILAKVIANILLGAAMGLVLELGLDAAIQGVQMLTGQRTDWNEDFTTGAAISGAVSGAVGGAAGSILHMGVGKLGRGAGKDIGDALDEVAPPPPKTESGGPGAFGKQNGPLDDIAPPVKQGAGKQDGPLDDVAPPVKEDGPGSGKTDESGPKARDEDWQSKSWSDRNGKQKWLSAGNFIAEGPIEGASEVAGEAVAAAASGQRVQEGGLPAFTSGMAQSYLENGMGKGGRSLASRYGGANFSGINGDITLDGMGKFEEFGTNNGPSDSTSTGPGPVPTESTGGHQDDSTTGHDKPNTTPATNDTSGKQDTGSETSSKQDSDTETSGKQDTGSESSGKQDTGSETSGRQDQAATGRPELSKHDSVTDQAGKQDSIADTTGEQDSAPPSYEEATGAGQETPGQSRSADQDQSGDDGRSADDDIVSEARPPSYAEATGGGQAPAQDTSVGANPSGDIGRFSDVSARDSLPPSYGEATGEEAPSSGHPDTSGNARLADSSKADREHQGNTMSHAVTGNQLRGESPPDSSTAFAPEDGGGAVATSRPGSQQDSALSQAGTRITTDTGQSSSVPAGGPFHGAQPSSGVQQTPAQPASGQSASGQSGTTQPPAEQRPATGGQLNTAALPITTSGGLATPPLDSTPTFEAVSGFDPTGVDADNGAWHSRSSHPDAPGAVAAPGDGSTPVDGDRGGHGSAVPDTGDGHGIGEAETTVSVAWQGNATAQTSAPGSSGVHASSLDQQGSRTGPSQSSETSDPAARPRSGSSVPERPATSGAPAGKAPHGVTTETADRTDSATVPEPPHERAEPDARTRQQVRAEADAVVESLGKVPEQRVEDLRLRAGAVVVREHQVPDSAEDREFFDHVTWIVAGELHAHGWTPDAADGIRRSAEAAAHALAVTKAHEFGTRRTSVPASGFGSAPGDAPTGGSRTNPDAGPSGAELEAAQDVPMLDAPQPETAPPTESRQTSNEINIAALAREFLAIQPTGNTAGFRKYINENHRQDNNKLNEVYVRSALWRERRQQTSKSDSSPAGKRRHPSAQQKLRIAHEFLKENPNGNTKSLIEYMDSHGHDTSQKNIIGLNKTLEKLRNESNAGLPPELDEQHELNPPRKSIPNRMNAAREFLDIRPQGSIDDFLVHLHNAGFEVSDQKKQLGTQLSKAKTERNSDLSGLNNSGHPTRVIQNRTELAHKFLESNSQGKLNHFIKYLADNNYELSGQTKVTLGKALSRARQEDKSDSAGRSTAQTGSRPNPDAGPTGIQSEAAQDVPMLDSPRPETAPNTADPMPALDLDTILDSFSASDAFDFNSTDQNPAHAPTAVQPVQYHHQELAPDWTADAPTTLPSELVDFLAPEPNVDPPNSTISHETGPSEFDFRADIPDIQISEVPDEPNNSVSSRSVTDSSGVTNSSLFMDGAADTVLDYPNGFDRYETSPFAEQVPHWIDWSADIDSINFPAFIQESAREFFPNAEETAGMSNPVTPGTSTIDVVSAEPMSADEQQDSGATGDRRDQPAHKKKTTAEHAREFIGARPDGRLGDFRHYLAERGGFDNHQGRDSYLSLALTNARKHHNKSSASSKETRTKTNLKQRLELARNFLTMNSDGDSSDFLRYLTGHGYEISQRSISGLDSTLRKARNELKPDPAPALKNEWPDTDNESRKPIKNRPDLVRSFLKVKPEGTVNDFIHHLHDTGFDVKNENRARLREAYSVVKREKISLLDAAPTSDHPGRTIKSKRKLAREFVEKHPDGTIDDFLKQLQKDGYDLSTETAPNLAKALRQVRQEKRSGFNQETAPDNTGIPIKNRAALAREFLEKNPDSVFDDFTKHLQDNGYDLSTENGTALSQAFRSSRPHRRNAQRKFPEYNHDGISVDNRINLARDFLKENPRGHLKEFISYLQENNYNLQGITEANLSSTLSKVKYAKNFTPSVQPDTANARNPEGQRNELARNFLKDEPAGDFYGFLEYLENAGYDTSRENRALLQDTLTRINREKRFGFHSDPIPGTTAAHPIRNNLDVAKEFLGNNPEGDFDDFFAHLQASGFDLSNKGLREMHDALNVAKAMQDDTTNYLDSSIDLVRNEPNIPVKKGLHLLGLRKSLPNSALVRHSLDTARRRVFGPAEAQLAAMQRFQSEVLVVDPGADNVFTAYRVAAPNSVRSLAGYTGTAYLWDRVARYVEDNMRRYAGWFDTQEALLAAVDDIRSEGEPAAKFDALVLDALAGLTGTRIRVMDEDANVDAARVFGPENGDEVRLLRRAENGGHYIATRDSTTVFDGNPTSLKMWNKPLSEYFAEFVAANPETHLHTIRRFRNYLKEQGRFVSSGHWIWTVMERNRASADHPRMAVPTAHEDAAPTGPETGYDSDPVLDIDSVLRMFNDDELVDFDDVFNFSELADDDPDNHSDDATENDDFNVAEHQSDVSESSLPSDDPGVTEAQFAALQDRDLDPIPVPADGDCFFAAARATVPGLAERFPSELALRTAVVQLVSDRADDFVGPLYGGDRAAFTRDLNALRRPGAYMNLLGDVVAPVLAGEFGLRLWIMDESGAARLADPRVPEGRPAAMLVRRDVAGGHYLGTESSPLTAEERRILARTECAARSWRPFFDYTLSPDDTFKAFLEICHLPAYFFDKKSRKYPLPTRLLIGMWATEMLESGGELSRIAQLSGMVRSRNLQLCITEFKKWRHQS